MPSDAERRHEFSPAFQRRDEAVSRPRRVATVEFAPFQASRRDANASLILPWPGRVWVKTSDVRLR
jgi:hypothetical protein